MFAQYAWVIWFFIAIISFVIEVRTPTFFVVCFGVGAIAAMLVAIFASGGLPKVQLAAFAFSSFITFLSIRNLADKIKKNNKKSITNVNSLPGGIALVTQQVGHGIEEGEVRIRGDYWRALSADGRIHKKNELVIIERRDGTLLYVRSFDKDKEVMS